jgi:anti-sigma regulatory factor (Ser/Thr protein kinase)
VLGARLRRRRRQGAASARFTLPATPAAPARARDEVRLALAGWSLENLCDTAMLLCSELVTNAVRHAGSSLQIALDKIGNGVRISVTDAEPDQWPQLAEPAIDDESSRGMWLVDRLATSWGTTTDENGKTVWFELTDRQPAG